VAFNRFTVSCIDQSDVFKFFTRYHEICSIKEVFG